MKNRNLLLILFLLFSVGAQAQNCDPASCYYAAVSKKGASDNKTILSTQEDIQAVLNEEIQRFTEFVSTDLEYPDLAKDQCFEGQVIVRVVYNHGFESTKIVQSANPLLDEAVMDRIKKYIENFDRQYEHHSRLVFKVPINFRLKG